MADDRMADGRPYLRNEKRFNTALLSTCLARLFGHRNKLDAFELNDIGFFEPQLQNHLF
jgi:hypothetical protein